jgi:hypothetical protein
VNGKTIDCDEGPNQVPPFTLCRSAAIH